VSKVLLDTHVLIWAIAAPERLSRRARAVMAEEAAVLLVSAASAWEIATKFRLGKLPHAEALLDTWDDALDRLKADPLPIDAAHARRAGLYAAAHRDPFDRLLAAQAELIGVPLVTTDGAFIDFPINTIW
jgi:PIN domain nuclease of toxin-antitoxin system